MCKAHIIVSKTNVTQLQYIEVKTLKTSNMWGNNKLASISLQGQYDLFKNNMLSTVTWSDNPLCLTTKIFLVSASHFYP